MNSSKITVRVDQTTLRKLDQLVRSGLYPNRSKAIQRAIEMSISVFEKERLKRESEKVNPVEELNLAEKAMAMESSEWAAY